MSKYQVRRTIKSELTRLNNTIDEKIIRGVSYAREARRHKQLLSKLYGLDHSDRNTFLGRLTSVFA